MSPHRPLDFATVLRIQLRLLWRRHRRGWMIWHGIIWFNVFLMSAFGVIVGVTVTSGEDRSVFLTQVQMLSEGFDVVLEDGGWALVFGMALACLFGLLWSCWIWSGESPRRRDYHWSLPVGRRMHDLARVVAGGVLLVAGVVVGVGIAWISDWIRSGSFGVAGYGAFEVLGLFAAPLLLYLLGSAFAVGIENPEGWLWGLVGICFLAFAMTTAAELAPGSVFPLSLLTGRLGLLHIACGPVGRVSFDLPVATGAEWLFGMGIWVALFVALIVVGAGGGWKRLRTRRSGAGGSAA